MNDLREKIKNIKNNNDLTDKEKNIMIQQLMNNNINITNSNQESCKHYPNKKCNNFYFACCNKNYCCVRCHNEHEIHDIKLETITCMECKVEQIPSNNCINCKIEFARIYCNLCYIWTELDNTHCYDCGICRIGKNNYHCDTCGICFNSKENHTCYGIKLNNSVCLFCLDNNLTSQKSAVIINCKHIFHTECIENAIKNNIINCPLCKKLMVAVDYSSLELSIKLQPMPELEINIGDIVKCKIFNKLIKILEINQNMYSGQFIDIDMFGIFNRESLEYIKKQKIYCYECEKNSIVNFHYLGHKCFYCKSYNTIY
jgi:RING finger/CHY zinc finger protein 1